MERVVDRSNVIRAFRRVKQNGGSPGVDGMTVEALPGYLSQHWQTIREALLSGVYRPHPVKRVVVPKPGGGRRLLGIPTVVDRLIQQALLQVLQAAWDKTFSDHSYGFRPGRSAHHAVARAQDYLHKGFAWVVDLDLEKFLETSSYCTPSHDRLSKRCCWAPNTLIYRPFRLPQRTCTAESSPRFTRCNTVCRDTPRSRMASTIGT
jgi:RNA-directed DNA polymerase